MWVRKIVWHGFQSLRGECYPLSAKLDHHRLDVVLQQEHNDQAQNSDIIVRGSVLHFHNGWRYSRGSGLEFDHLRQLNRQRSLDFPTTIRELEKQINWRALADNLHDKLGELRLPHGHRYLRESEINVYLVGVI